MMPASAVSAPTRVARKVKAPVVLTVPPVTSTPLRFPTGSRFAGDHGFVDMRGAVDDDSIRRDALAGPDHDEIADDDVVDRQSRLLGAVALHARGLGLQRGERADRFRVRPLARASSVRPNRISVTMTTADS